MKNMVRYSILVCLTKGPFYTAESAKVRDILEDIFFSEEKKTENQPHLQGICCSSEKEKGTFLGYQSASLYIM